MPFSYLLVRRALEGSAIQVPIPDTEHRPLKVSSLRRLVSPLLPSGPPPAMCRILDPGSSEAGELADDTVLEDWLIESEKSAAAVDHAESSARGTGASHGPAQDVMGLSDVAAEPYGRPDHWPEVCCQWGLELSSDPEDIFYACHSSLDIAVQAQPDLFRILFRSCCAAEHLEGDLKRLIQHLMLEGTFVRRTVPDLRGYACDVVDVPESAWDWEEEIPDGALVRLETQSMDGFRKACDLGHPCLFLREGLSDVQIEHHFFSET